MTNKAVWEILVPTTRPDGRPIKTRYHRVWDEYVQQFSGGMTIMAPSKGHWVNEDDVVIEKMIPVTIICDRETIELIIDFTIKHYEQKAVLAYKVADEFIMKYRDSKKDDDRPQNPTKEFFDELGRE